MLQISNLSVHFSYHTARLKRREMCAIKSLDLSVRPGQIMAVIGQSGAGKSLLVHALLGLLPCNARVEGNMIFKGKSLAFEDLQAMRGRHIALIPQTVTSLNPLSSVGKQVFRAALLGGITRVNVPATVNGAFTRYKLNSGVAGWYPFQLSGGMARRVLAATATVGKADLILADEPTAGLDAIRAGETLNHLRELADGGRAVILITHDIATALRVADMISIFHQGTTVEVANATDFKEQDRLRHPYTKLLWHALPANEFLNVNFQFHNTSSNTGCSFASVCPCCGAECRCHFPDLREVTGGRVRCHNA